MVPGGQKVWTDRWTEWTDGWKEGRMDDSKTISLRLHWRIKIR